MKTKALICAAWCVAAVCAAGVDAAYAMPVRWKSTVVHVALEGKDLKDVLRDFAASQGIPTSIAGNVQGTVTGRFDLPPQRFLDTLAATFGFVWFYDGNVLSISNANDMTRQILPIDHASIGQLRSALRQIGMDDKRFPIFYDGVSATVLVSGPVQYVQTVADIARRLDVLSGRRTGSTIRVFKLKHAWAADRDVQIDGNKVTVPGVATVLANMYRGRAGRGAVQPSVAPGVQRVQSMSDVSGSAFGGSPQVPPLPPNMTGGGQGETFANGARTGREGGGSSAPSADGSPRPGDPSAGDDESPIIQPDPMTNSVLIRDSSDRLAEYASLIEQLDSRPRLIEIQAHIMEIDDDLLRQIGVDWRAHNSHGDIQTGMGAVTQNSYGSTSTGIGATAQNSYANGQINPFFGTTTLPGNAIANAPPAGAAITAVVGDAARYLMARVNALQSTSKVKIDASPLVATLDNSEAVMDNMTRFFVRVSGYTSADLYSIATGVSLRVLPLIVQDGSETRIKLNVHVTDGQLTGDLVDSIPVVTSSEINTQAFVGQGESLLIAGYSTDKRSNGVTGVPWLSKIPLIGALFRYNSDEHSHMERVFLLSPRIIDPDK
ncbi:type III secretion system outer membrane ring subunit SctC [Burkholderia oklahomensis]|uniref:Type 3 secretion system secretin n=1 Tax=Burkholderia oklahomensis TaxID=342113 RepID=A0AAI8BDX2_9BURK|nr:type III secretion system outer membrane ring subunit SctC [Burkholderia oklahomensis]AIO70224.1 type III secretion outer membrane pore, YscC/HrcC family [Burkholderia oklahomensis]AOI39590.1 secretin [Burkholderia oklahomensis EO147]KUY51521.1 secretin [Burkholderia oklahomensis EO147]QPS40057.1 type III secretion system outer membrane ring subunit SctC [Burkholderia oklahomensis]